MFGQLLIAPLGSALTLEIFVAPSPVLLRQVFTTEVCVKMFGEELGPGNGPCEGWNQSVVLETPGLEPPVGNKCSQSPHSNLGYRGGVSAPPLFGRLQFFLFFWLLSCFWRGRLQGWSGYRISPCEHQTGYRGQWRD
jgi:hypothetical protein